MAFDLAELEAEVAGIESGPSAISSPVIGNGLDLGLSRYGVTADIAQAPQQKPSTPGLNA